MSAKALKTSSSVRPAVLFLFLLLFLSGCAIGGGGVHHTVRRGENLWRICHTYGVDMQEVAELNGIEDPTDIKAGMRLYIPGVSHKKKVPRVGQYPDAQSSKYDGKIELHKGMFAWPVKGQLASEFGFRNGEHHDGIDIRAPKGTTIKAAGNGSVVFVNSQMRGYGKIIIIKHDGDYYTVYAHNMENDVKKGDHVARGEPIGKVGDTGNADGYHLHFEVRKGKKVRNPLFFLP